MKCIDVKSNAFRVPLLIWIVAVLVLIVVHPVKAETGFINISSSPALNYLPPLSGANQGGNVNWTQLNINQVDYNNYGELDFSYGSGQYNLVVVSALPSNFTSFTWESGNGAQTGTGMYSYIRGTCTFNCVNVTWTFSGLITNPKGHFINITYTYPTVPAEITGSSAENDCGVNCTSYPFTVTASSFPGTSTIMYGWYRAYTGLSLTNAYNITYPFPGKFQATVTKDSIISTKDWINSSTIMYAGQTVFDKTALNYFGNQADGIYINVTTATGLYSNVLINSSGFSPAPTPTPAPGGVFNPTLPTPTSGGSIQFNQTKYVVGDTVRVEWAISNADWNGIGQTFIINFYQNDVAFLTDAFPTGQIPISSQTGNYSFIVNQPSVIRADLDGGFLFATNVLGSAYTTIVPATPAFISVPATAQQGQNVTINYGFAAGSTVNTGFIKDVVLDDFGQPILTTLTYTNLSCPCGTSGTISKIFGSTGKHRLTLFDATALKTVATADIQISASGVAPGLNITSNSLTLDNAVYNYNDVIIGSYQISTANYSLYPYFRISLISNSGIFGNSIDVPSSQTGTFQLPVNSGMFQTLQSGAAFVNLTAQSSAFNNTLVLMAYVPVTINANFNGYSVSANPQTICKNQPVYVKYTGQTGTGTLKTTWVTLAGTTKTNSFNFSANGTKVFSFADGTIMDKSAVQFDIYDLAGNFQVGSIVKYQSTGCTQAGTTTTATATPGQVQSGGSAWNSANINLLSLIAMPAFYGLLILIGSIIACSRNEKAASSTGIVAFIVANVEAVIGLWAPFTLYILVVTWVLLGIYFTVGRKTTTQN